MNDKTKTIKILRKKVRKHFNNLKDIKVSLKQISKKNNVKILSAEFYILVTNKYHVRIRITDNLYEIEELIRGDDPENKELSLCYREFFKELNHYIFKNKLYNFRKKLIKEGIKPKHITKRNWKRIKTYTIEEIFEDIKIKKENNLAVNKRLNVFYTKGLKCSNPLCDRIGTYFALEIDKGDGKHIDLFTTEHILMTVDHYIPVSKGGKWDMENTNPMCEPCNRKKGDKIPESK